MTQIIPHWEVFHQVHAVMHACPINSWEEQPLATQRAWGLIGRWSIERLFEAVSLAKGEPLSADRSLVAMHHQSGVRLLPEQNLLLGRVDRLVSATELQLHDDVEVYRDACRLAKGLLNLLPSIYLPEGRKL